MRILRLSNILNMKKLKSLFLVFLLGTGFVACSSTKGKPTRLMIYASAALKAAQKAGAERKDPDAYRKAESAMWEAKSKYAQKRWQEAAKAASEARRYAELAEINAEVRTATSGGDFY